MKICFYILCCFSITWVNAQVMLEANGKEDTYKLINQQLSLNANVVETPDCVHTDFGPHITQEWDKDLNKYVFVFHAHLNIDNDRCKKEDRQRIEIKTYKKSPANLIAHKGDKFQYTWLFKLEKDFSASKRFTHLHQIKAIGGPEDKMPNLTLTARRNSNNSQKLQLLYAEKLDQEEIFSIDLDKIKGKWIKVIETITFNEAKKSTYKISFYNYLENTLIDEYENNKLRIWKTNAEVLRPKWGIYRSILSPEYLKDEQVKYDQFSIEKLN